MNILQTDASVSAVYPRWRGIDNSYRCETVRLWRAIAAQMLHVNVVQ